MYVSPAGQVAFCSQVNRPLSESEANKGPHLDCSQAERGLLKHAGEFRSHRSDALVGSTAGHHSRLVKPVFK